MKKKLILTTVASVLTIGAVSGAVALNSTPQKTGADTSPITTTLQQQQDELNNHEARITNTENNVQAVASKTGTTTTVVEQVPTPSLQTTAVAPTPVIVTAYEKLAPDSDGTIDCKLTYSDSTTYQWHWYKTHNGVTSTFNACDDTVIGQVKN